MELREFLEKFLPDYEKKEIDFTINEIGLPFRIKVESQKFFEKHFAEALQNFADKICEKQRENSKASYWNVANIGYDINIVFQMILNAEQPKIDELS